MVTACTPVTLLCCVKLLYTILLLCACRAFLKISYRAKEIKIIVYLCIYIYPLLSINEIQEAVDAEIIGDVGIRISPRIFSGHAHNCLFGLHM